MKQTDQNQQQKGFAHVGLILIVIVVIAAATFGGWWVWDKNKQKDTDRTSQSSQSQEENKPTDPSEGGKYLVIAEWGVRFPLPEGLRGDVLTHVSTTDVSGTVLFASKQVNGLAGDDSCAFIQQSNGSYSGGLQASLSRINPATYPSNLLGSFKEQLNYIKSIDTYDYYSRKVTELTCATAIGGNDPIPGLYDAEQSISNQLNEAFKNIETIE